MQGLWKMFFFFSFHLKMISDPQFVMKSNIYRQTLLCGYFGAKTDELSFMPPPTEKKEENHRFVMA